MSKEKKETTGRTLYDIMVSHTMWFVLLILIVLVLVLTGWLDLSGLGIARGPAFDQSPERSERVVQEEANDTAESLGASPQNGNPSPSGSLYEEPQRSDFTNVFIKASDYGVAKFDSIKYGDTNRVFAKNRKALQRRIEVGSRLLIYSGSRIVLDTTIKK